MSYNNTHVSVYLIAPMISWVLTQMIKVVTKGENGKYDWRNIYRSGSMPSSHAAVVVSLATMIFLQLGFNSPEFGIAAVFAGVVMYDAVNVRQAVGEHGLVLKKLLDEYNKTVGKSKVKRIRESLGHTPREVLVGSLVGAIISIVIYVV